MNDLAVRVDNLGKCYRIGRRADDRNLRELINDAIAAPFRRRHEADADETEFWALKDVSFEVQRGEVVGIIGRNGAGKSTLLKILSRITDPTKGRAEIHGRVGSLLEIGTGFHPELSGRENIYLNGAILGMKRAEIARQFDEIVAFAEIEQFLDTPVKRYSSGMYVRLAFAVAAHLQPEILIVDEVLAVGDAAFQKKCLGKMGDVAQEGRTVLFVSHNMGAIEHLCSTGLVLESGELTMSGPIADCVFAYLRKINANTAVPLARRRVDIDASPFYLHNIYLADAAGNALDYALCGSPVSLVLEYEAALPMLSGAFAVAIYTDYGYKIAHCRSDVTLGEPWEITSRAGRAVIHFPKWSLAPGNYIINVSLWKDGKRTDFVQPALAVQVDEGCFYPSGKLPVHGGVVLLEHTWEHVPSP